MEHRSGSRNLRYFSYWTFLTTEAKLDKRYRDSVERYLTDVYNPVVNVGDSTEEPISVNLFVR